MMTDKRLSSASHTTEYFEVDDYYTRENAGEHQAKSEWYGKGAQTLGLSGQVVPTDFRATLEGKLPTGDQLGRIVKGERQHHPGWDFTLAPPKSVSLMIELGGDKRLLDAHNQAVKDTFDLMESLCAYTRSSQNGKVVPEKGEGLTAAFFLHNTNRDQDPFVHTHMILMNAVQRRDGQWRSLESDTWYQHKMMGGNFYRAQMADYTKNLGYGIDRTGKGLFDIAGVPREMIESYSTRRQDIEKHMKEHGLTGAKAGKVAALATRRGKDLVGDWDGLRDTWKERLGDDGQVLLDRLRDQSFERQAPLEQDRQARDAREHSAESSVTGWLSALKTTLTDLFGKPDTSVSPPLGAVRYALAHHSERQSAFAEKDVMRTAIEYAVGRCDGQSVLEVYKDAQRAGFVLPAPAYGPGMVTTQQAVDMERQILEIAKMGHGVCPPLVDLKTLDGAMASTFLNKSQQFGAELVLSSKDRFIGLQGYAGTGKTTLLTEIQRLVADRGIILQGLAPSGSAVKGLREHGIPADTIQYFLSRYKGVAYGRLSAEGQRTLEAEYRNTLFVVDESSFISTRQMRDFLTIVDTVQSRALLVGDKKQLGAIEAGKPFAELQKLLMPPAIVDEVIRQRDPDLKQAVYQTIAGNVQGALRTLGKNIEVHDRSALARTAGAYWLGRSPEERSNTLLVAPSNKMRQNINEVIRAGLSKEGRLTGEPVHTDSLRDTRLTPVEKTQVMNYREDQVVQFHRNYKRLGVKKEDYLTIVGINDRENTLTLRPGKGRDITWNPDKNGDQSTAYTVDPKALQVGERLRWTEGKRGKDMLTGEEATVLDLKEQSAQVQLADGDVRWLDLSRRDNQHYDHAYATTVHTAQGVSVNHLIGVVEPQKHELTSLESFYVTISRARDSALLLTDDLKFMAQQIIQNAGGKASSLEGVQMNYSEWLDKLTRDGLTVAEAVDRIVDVVRHPEANLDNAQDFNFWADRPEGIAESERSAQMEAAQQESNKESSWMDYFGFGDTGSDTEHDKSDWERADDDSTPARDREEEQLDLEF